ncbi:hypothetical protein [Actinotalea sp. C106]|uniref:hypothetical protein n=1 Tax=Actinotalea sp. C106 TaxID=2908644 RepID=UPI0020277A33|nr:hypothetical protein [Actinotalea sp. C106]
MELVLDDPGYDDLTNSQKLPLVQLARRVIESTNEYSRSRVVGDDVAKHLDAVNASRWTVAVEVAELAKRSKVSVSVMEKHMLTWREKGLVEALPGSDWELTRNRLVYLPRARRTFRATRRSAILLLEQRRARWSNKEIAPGVTGDDTTPAAVVVDALIAAWRAANPVVHRGAEHPTWTVPMDTVAAAIPAMVKAFCEDSMTMIDVTEDLSELPEGRDAAFWGEPAELLVGDPHHPEDGPTEDEAFEALEEYWRRRKAKSPRQIARKLLPTLSDRYGITTPAQIVEIVDDGVLLDSLVNLTRPSQVKSAVKAATECDERTPAAGVPHQRAASQVDLERWILGECAEHIDALTEMAKANGYEDASGSALRDLCGALNHFRASYEARHGRPPTPAALSEAAVAFTDGRLRNKRPVQVAGISLPDEPPF